MPGALLIFHDQKLIEMIVLVINCGSSSVKYQIIQSDTEECLCSGLIERIGAVTSIVHHHPTIGDRVKKSIQIETHDEAILEILNFIKSGTYEGFSGLEDIVAVGHRVVHGGETFKDSVMIDDSVIDAIEHAIDLAPLHNPPNLMGIRAAKKALPDLPHVAVFDTAFHHSLPAKSYLYGIPNRFYRRYKIRRYGFHGPSHYYVSRKYFSMNGIESGQPGTRVISCHLGNGASICAIKDGKSVDTSMGFTPLEGLVMGTRSGDIDPSILFYLVEKEELTLTALHSLLNRHSGLLGLSGYAADMRDLIEEAKAGDRRCQQAIDVFCYRAKKYVTSYMGVLNGADAIIFTGGIGENSADVRAEVCSDLSFFGIEIDKKRNESPGAGEQKISTENSKVEVWIIPTNEELVIAKDATKIATAARQSPWL